MQIRIYNRKAHRYQFINTEDVRVLDLYDSDPIHGMGKVAIFVLDSHSDSKPDKCIFAKPEDALGFIKVRDVISHRSKVIYTTDCKGWKKLKGGSYLLHMANDKQLRISKTAFKKSGLASWCAQL